MTYFKKSLALLTVITLLFVSLFSFSTVSAEEITADENIGGLIPITPITPPGEDDEPVLPNNLPEIDPIEDGAVYRIKNLQTGRYLTLEPDENGVYDATLNNICTANYNGSSAQEFRIEDNFGTYYIRAIKSSNGMNRLVDVHSSNINQIVDNANVHLHHPGDENSSQWLIEYNATLGRYAIKIACKPNLAITDATISGTGGNPDRYNAQINTFSATNTAQNWIFEKVERTPRIDSGDVYRIKDLNSGLYLSVTGTDTNLSNVSLSGGNVTSTNKLFRIVYDEANEMYYIKAVKSSNGDNRVLDIYSNPNSLPADGRNVHLYAIELFDNYNSCGWQIYEFSKDIYGDIIVKICSDYDESLVLTAANGGTVVGTNVQVNTYTGEKHQQWILEKHEEKFENVPQAGEFEINETIQLTAPSFVENPVWVSSNTNVATVSSTGLVRAVGNGNCKIFAYNSTQTVIEATGNITVGNIIGELTIYSTTSEILSSIENLGHSFIAFKNTTNRTLNCGVIPVSEGEEITFGTYRSNYHTEKQGVWYNIDSFTCYDGSVNINDLVSLTIDITLEDLEIINSYIAENDIWGNDFTCATFATGLWNAVSDTPLASTILPSALINSITECEGYEIGRLMKNVYYYGYLYDNKVIIEWPKEVIG